VSLPFRAENLVTQLRNFIILVLLQFVAAASMSASSFDFVSPRTFSVGDAPYSVAMADFNGDGKLDLAVGNQFYYVSILMGYGDGTFGPPVNYNLGDETEARSIVVGDFNGDGHPDLAVGILDGIQVLINKGDGTFYPPVLYGVGGFPCQPASIAIGDFNRDHKLDLVAATVYCGVAVLQGNGDGTFQTFKAHNAGTHVVGVAAGDLNNDGKLDLAVADQEGTDGEVGELNILIGNGDGSFKAPVSYKAGATAEAVVLGDFNHDGHLDVAVANFISIRQNNPDTNSIDVFIGKGDGRFGKPKSYPVGSYPVGGLAVADINGDGKPDLVVGNLFDNDVSVLLGTGQGTFRPEVVFQVGNGPRHLAVGDLRSTGQMDIVTADSIDGDVTVLLNPGTAGLDTAFVYHAAKNAWILSPGDFTSHGRTDLAVVGTNSGSELEVAVLPSMSNGRFGRKLSTYLKTGKLTLASRLSAVAGDFNHDGNLDLALSHRVAENSAQVVTILLGKGDGRFTIGKSYSFGVYYSAYPGIVTGDFNGDGILDLATIGVTSSGESDVFVMFGNGDGTFQSPTTYSSGAEGGEYVDAIAAADFNNDGVLDLVVANSESSYSSDANVSLLIGNKDGTFQSPVAFTANGALPTIIAGDFNHDGNEDVAIAGTDAQNNGALFILMGNGKGSLTLTQQYAGPNGRSIATGDFNHDGNLDLAATGWDANNNPELQIFHGNGDGTFGSPDTYRTGQAPFAIAAGKFARQAGPDLAIVDAGNDDFDAKAANLTVYLNRMKK
jgi:hypothetical protein